MEYLKNLITDKRIRFIAESTYFLYKLFVIFLIGIIIFQPNVVIKKLYLISAATKATQTTHTQFSDVILDQYKKELGLVLPEVIDDPAYKVVFSNPAKDKPVEFIIDGRQYKNVKSPFPLPNLSLGTHTVVIKFSNKDEVPRTITMNVTVVPKSPVISQTNKTLFYRPNPIVIKGKAMAFSKVMVIINGSDVQYTNVDANGDWTFLIKTPKQGTYKLLFFTFNKGIISKKYAVLSVKYQTAESITVTVVPTQVPVRKRVINLITRYKREGLGVAIIVTGLSLIWVAVRIRKYFKKKWETKEIAELINKGRPKVRIDEVVRDLNIKDDNDSNKRGDKNKATKSIEKTELVERKIIKKATKKKQTKKKQVSNIKTARNGNTKVAKKTGFFNLFSKGDAKAKNDTVEPSKKKVKNSKPEEDITSMVFGQEATKDNNRNKKKNTKRKPSNKRKDLAKENKKKQNEKVKNKKSGKKSPIKVDKKELSKNEFLSLFKKAKK